MTLSFGKNINITVNTLKPLSINAHTHTHTMYACNVTVLLLLVTYVPIQEVADLVNHFKSKFIDGIKI